MTACKRPHGLDTDAVGPHGEQIGAHIGRTVREWHGSDEGIRSFDCALVMRCWAAAE
jgi:hypothetical protein